MTTDIKEKLRKIFGVGPLGAGLSLLLLIPFAGADAAWNLPITRDHGNMLILISLFLIIAGLGLHLRTLFFLRRWWVDGQLCTRGPFARLRHPMYAAWVSLICPGAALYLNSWFYLAWLVPLHIIWHLLVKKEEALMADTFGEAYQDYARRTGRFFPRFWH